MIENDCDTFDAALKLEFPDWLAVSVHVPTDTGVTVKPETLHTPVVLLTRETARPDDALTETSNEGRY